MHDVRRWSSVDREWEDLPDGTNTQPQQEA